MTKRIKTFFTAGIEVSSHYEARKLYMTNSLLFIMASVMSIFSVLNFTAFAKPHLGALDIIAAIIPVYTFFQLRLEKNINKASKITTYSVLFITLIFTYINQNNNFGLIWSIFLPLFAMTLRGPKEGLKITMFYYAIMLPMVFSGIGIWQNGEWNMQSAIRYTVVSAALVFIVYMYERSLYRFHTSELKSKQRLENLSRIDELTQLFNRRALNERLVEEFEKFYRHKNPFSITILDIDNFKNINDTYGHHIGDIVLKEISKTLSIELRKTEVLGRWGGEEFIILFPNTTADIAVKASEKIRKIIEAYAFTEVGTVTSSFGVAQYMDSTSIEELLAQADQALYEAKHTGKNKVVLYQETEKLKLEEA